jgi:hypothetical protein
MPSNPSMNPLQQRKTADRTERLIFFLIAGSVILAVLLLSKILDWKEASFESLAHDILIASVVSVIIFLVESRLHDSRIDQIEFSVLQSILRSLVTEKIADEMMMAVREPLYRKNLYFKITLLPDADPEQVKIQRQLSYELHNNTDIDQPHTLSLRADKAVGVPKPSNIEIEIDGKKQVLPQAWKRGAEGVFDDGSAVRVVKNLVVPRAAFVAITTNAEEHLLLNERSNTYVILWPSEGLTVELTNGYQARVKRLLDPELNHRKGVALTQRTPSRYEYLGGILPGQSFQIRWEI